MSETSHDTNISQFEIFIFLLGMAGALVGADISEALFHFDLVHVLIGAGLGAAFFVIGWRQLQPP